MNINQGFCFADELTQYRRQLPPTEGGTVNILPPNFEGTNLARAEALEYGGGGNLTCIVFYADQHRCRAPSSRTEITRKWESAGSEGLNEGKEKWEQITRPDRTGL